MAIADFPSEVLDFIESDAGYLLREDVKDTALWYHIPTNLSVREAACHLFLYYETFRSQLDYRLQKSGAFWKRYRPLPDLPRATDLNIAVDSIGPRMRIQHGHGT